MLQKSSCAHQHHGIPHVSMNWLLRAAELENAEGGSGAKLQLFQGQGKLCGIEVLLEVLSLGLTSVGVSWS